MVANENGNVASWRYCRRPVPTITITIDEAKQHGAKALGTTADKIIIEHS